MPVYSSHLVDYPGLGISERIRQERQRKGFTLRQFAKMVRISPAQLSNIENGKARMDLAGLLAIADVLSAPLGMFFPRTVEHHYLVKRREEVALEKPIRRDLIVGPEAGPRRHHNLVWPLADLFMGRHMEPLLGQIQPLADKSIHFIAHDHEEFMFVLRGEVESLVKTNDALITERLGAGDCLYFRSYLPHCHRSTTSEPAKTLHVTYSIRGAIDSDVGEFGPSGHKFYRLGAYADITKEAAEKIGLLRRSRGFTLAELARSVGVGSRQLSQIERGEKSPDLGLLLRLARKFARPIEYFFATTLEQPPYYFVQRGRQIEDVPLRKRKGPIGRNGGSPANVYRPLALGFSDRGMHPYYVQVKNISHAALTPHTHHGQEFIYVLDGEVELLTYSGEEEIRETLRAGDSLFLESSIPHLLLGDSRNPYAATSAELIVVFWSPLGEEYLFDGSS